MTDLRAVLEAAGADRPALFGVAEGGPMSILFAATYPERVRYTLTRRDGHEGCIRYSRSDESADRSLAASITASVMRRVRVAA